MSSHYLVSGAGTCDKRAGYLVLAPTRLSWIAAQYLCLMFSCQDVPSRDQPQDLVELKRGAHERCGGRLHPGQHKRQCRDAVIGGSKTREKWGGGGVKDKPLLGVAHAGAVLQGHHDFLGGEFGGEEHAGDLGAVDAGAFELGLTKVHAAQVGLPKVAIAEIQARGIQAPQVHATKVAGSEIAGLAPRLLGVELLDQPVPQELVHGIRGDAKFSDSRLSLSHGYSPRFSYRCAAPTLESPGTRLSRAAAGFLTIRRPRARQPRRPSPHSAGGRLA